MKASLLNKLDILQDRFEELLAYNAQTRSWSGLVLTGSEITLRKDLPELVRRARASGFERVRIRQFIGHHVIHFTVG